MTSIGVLTIDEGTTGTRATIIDQQGRASELFYERLHTTSPQPGVVEQDATEILTKTLDVMRRAIASAKASNTEIVGVAIATQRATATLWDRETGKPLCPSMVWQDSRYSGYLDTLSGEWDEKLRQLTGRPVGIRSPYLWATDQMKNIPEVAKAYSEGRLVFGTVDTWLLWHLTEGRHHGTSATNATSCGATNIRDFDYYTEWLDELEFPTELLPELLDDVIPTGKIDLTIDGESYPLLALVGDQHASMAGLGVISRGSSMVMHGTGSFVDLIVGEKMPWTRSDLVGTLSLIGWREEGLTRYSVETYTAATGSSVDMLCDQLGWFKDAAEINRLSREVTGAHGVTFLPTMTGIRSPYLSPHVRGSLSGVSTATTKPQIAYAILEGVAQFVAQSMEANSIVAGIPTSSINVGGGLARADVLLQVQADLAGTPMRRHANADLAALKGAAFLGASRGALWNSLDEAVAVLEPGDIFEPAISEDERLERRARWRRRIDFELELAEG